MPWGYELPDLPGFAGHGGIDDNSDIEDDEEFEKRIVGLHEREKQRQRRLRANKIQEREAQLEAAKAETTSSYELGTRAIQAVKKPIVKGLGTAAAEATELFEPLEPGGTTPGLPGTPRGPGGAARKVNLFNPELARSTTEGIAGAVIPGSPAEVIADLAGGLALKGGAAAVRGGVNLARGLRTADRVDVPEALYHWTPNKNLESILENKLRPGSWLARSPEEAAKQARLPGLRTEGSVVEVRPQLGQVKTGRTTLTRRPSFRATEELEAVGSQTIPGPRNPLRELVTSESGSADFNKFLEERRGPNISNMSIGDMKREYEAVSQQVANIQKQFGDDLPDNVADELDGLLRRLDYLEQAGTKRQIDLIGGLEQTLRDAGALTRKQSEARTARRQAAQGPANRARDFNRFAQQVADATGQDVKAVRELLRTATPSQKGTLRKLVNTLGRLAGEERGSIPLGGDRVPLPGGGGTVGRSVPESVEQRTTRLQPSLDAIRNRINERTRLGEPIDMADLDEYARVLEEIQGRTGVPSQPLPPTRPELPLQGQSYQEPIRKVPEGAPGLTPQAQAVENARQAERKAIEDARKAGEEALAASNTAARKKKIQDYLDSLPARAPEAKPPTMSQAEYDELLKSRPSEALRGTKPPGINYSDLPEDWSFDKKTKWIETYKKAEAAGSPIGPGIPGEPPTPPSPPGGRPLEPGLPGLPPPHSKTSVMGEVLRSIASIPGEAIANVTSLSPPTLRQNRTYTMLHPAQAARNIIKSFHGAFSEKYFERADSVMRSSPWVRRTEGGAFNSGYTWEDLGGHLLSKDAPIEERELVANSWLGEVLRGHRGPKAVRAIFGIRHISDREAIMEMNLARTDWYQKVASAMWDAGERDIARYTKTVKDIEHFTQRGSWGQGNVPWLFSTRSLSGRAQALWDIATQVPTTRGAGSFIPGTKYSAVPGPEREAAKALVSTVAANMIMLGSPVGLGAGALVLRKDGLPTFRDGSFHWDPWAGWGGQAKVILGLVADIEENFGDAIRTGGWESLPENMAEDVADRAYRFFQTQLSPVFGKVSAIASGRDFAGRQYDLSEDIKSGKFFRDTLVPFNLVTLIKGIQETDPISAVAIGTASTFSESVDFYNNLTELRDDAAKRMSSQGAFVDPDTKQPKLDENGNPVKVSNYREASPDEKEQIDAQAEVAKFREENPSPYQIRKDRLEANSPGIKEAQAAEARHREDTPTDKPLTEYWQNENEARRELAKVLADDFEDMFEDFDRTKFDKALDEYYAINPETIRDPRGNPGWDEAENARQEWLAKQDPKVRQWVDEALGVSRRKKSEPHQEYLEAIDKKKAAGYFEKDVDEAKLEELDRQHPDLDVATWLYRGNTIDKKTGDIVSPALQSLKAVDQALALNRNRPIKYSNIKRQINESETTKAAWQEHSNLLDFYMQGGNTAAKNAAADKLAGVTYDKLNEDGQKKVKDFIRTAMRSDPQTQATLVWWGANNVDSVKNKATADALIALMKKYGPLLKEED